MNKTNWDEEYSLLNIQELKTGVTILPGDCALFI
jgi:hypothetical protein